MMIFHKNRLDSHFRGNDKEHLLSNLKYYICQNHPKNNYEFTSRVRN